MPGHAEVGFDLQDEANGQEGLLLQELRDIPLGASAHIGEGNLAASHLNSTLEGRERRSILLV